MIAPTSLVGVIMRSMIFSGLLIAFAAGPAVSQRLPTPFQSALAADPRGPRVLVQAAPEPGIHSPLLAAAGLGLLGWGVGALAGHAIEGDCNSEYCGLEGIFYGGAAGGGLGLAVGAHLGNRRRGSFPLDLLASGAVWGVGYAMMHSYADNSDGTGVVLTAILLPPTQLLATVIVERARGHSRAGRTRAP